MFSMMTRIIHVHFIIACCVCSRSLGVIEGLDATAPLLRRRRVQEDNGRRTQPYGHLDNTNFIVQQRSQTTTHADQAQVWDRLLQESVGMSLTDTPTFAPNTEAPSGTAPVPQPTRDPTAAPSHRPTDSPTRVPTSQPTSRPTRNPTNPPTASPTNEPTRQPTSSPTRNPTNPPTASPTNEPTSQPTSSPSNQPTGIPTQTPEDCSANGVCNENCSVLTPDPDCPSGPVTTPQCSPVTSDFEDGDEGWIITGDASTVDPNYSSSGGNPGGYIFAVDEVTGGVWRFQAPQKFLGDFSGAYGLSLSFDLIQTAITDQFSSRDVIIEGGGSLIWFDTPNNPSTTWTSYSIPLQESAGWQRNDNTIATEQEILTVLSSIEDIQVRGEFRSGADTGSLDNFVLESFCAPTSAPTAPAAVLFDVFLVDARDDSVIRPVINGQIIEIESFSDDVEFSLLADADDDTTTAVNWVLSDAETGAVIFSFTDDSSPFTASGEVGEDILPVSQLSTEGRYLLTVTPVNSDGVSGEPITRIFSIVDSFDGGTGTNRGTEFWIVELPNLETLPVNRTGVFGIAVINTAPTEAQVEIIHIDSQAAQTFSVSPNGVRVVQYPRRGVGTDGAVVTSVPAYRVLSDEEVVVYAISPLVDVRSNDAAVILPTAGLGTEYRVLGYRSPTSNFVGTVYAAIATEDSTLVQVFNPSGSLIDDQTLEAGQVLQRQEQFDQTGYRIVADKPIAVFSGSRCTAAGDSSEFCDILYEQILPEQSIGSTYLSCPSLSRPIGCSDQTCAPDIFRYLATEGGTTVNYADNTAALNAGGFVEFETNVPHLVTASGPIYAYQVLISQRSSPNTPMTGDPAMIAIPPVEQYQFDYVFYTPPTFTTNFVNVMAPNGVSLTIDGTAQADIDCTGNLAGTIGGVEYCCEGYEVEQGVHTIEGSEPFGIYATGFAPFSSYGYTGGTGLQSIASGCASGGPYRVTSCTTPVTATLNGSASCDNGATPLVFWSTPDVTVAFEDVTDPVTTVSVEAFGSFVICLDVVCDGITTQCCSSINIMEMTSEGGACP